MAEWNREIVSPRSLARTHARTQDQREGVCMSGRSAEKSPRHLWSVRSFVFCLFAFWFALSFVFLSFLFLLVCSSALPLPLAFALPLSLPLPLPLRLPFAFPLPLSLLLPLLCLCSCASSALPAVLRSNKPGRLREIAWLCGRIRVHCTSSDGAFTATCSCINFRYIDQIDHFIASI